MKKEAVNSRGAGELGTLLSGGRRGPRAGMGHGDSLDVAGKGEDKVKDKARGRSCYVAERWV